MTPTSRSDVPAMPAGERERQIEHEIIIEILRSDREQLRSRSHLEHRLPYVDQFALNDALARLQQREIVRVDRETVEAFDLAKQRQALDALAAVVKIGLVQAAPRAVSLVEVGIWCERDLDKPAEREEIELALRLLVIDGLACSQGDGWSATRPAVRSEQLSF